MKRTMDTKMTNQSLACFKWSKKQHLLGTFLEKNGVPNLVRVKEGHQGINDACTIEKDQLLMLHALLPKHSFTAEDSLGRTIALPVDCQNKLLVCSMSGTCDGILVSEMANVFPKAKYFRVVENKRAEDRGIGGYFEPESIFEVDCIDARNSVVKFKDVEEPVPYSCSIVFEALLDYREYTLKEAAGVFGLPIKVRFLLSRNDEKSVDDECCEYKVSNLGRVTVFHISKPDLVVAAIKIDADQSLTLPAKSVKCLQISKSYSLQVSVAKRLLRNNPAYRKMIRDFNGAFLAKYDLKKLQNSEDFQHIEIQDEKNFRPQITSAVLAEQVPGKNDMVYAEHDNNVHSEVARKSSFFKTPLAILRRCTRRRGNDTVRIDRTMQKAEVAKEGSRADFEHQNDVYNEHKIICQRTKTSEKRHESPLKNDREPSNNHHSCNDDATLIENHVIIRSGSQASINPSNYSASSRSRDHMDEEMPQDYVNMISPHYLDMTSQDFVDMTSLDYVDMTSHDYVDMTSRDYVDMSLCDYVDMSSRDYVDMTSRDYVDMTAQRYVRTSLQKENDQGVYVNCPGVMLPSANPQRNNDLGKNAIKNTVFEHGIPMCPETKRLDFKSENSAEAIGLDNHTKEQSKLSTKDRSMLNLSGTETKELEKENEKEISDGTIRMKARCSSHLEMLATEIFGVKLKHVNPAATSGCMPDNNNLEKTNSSQSVTIFPQNAQKRPKKAPVSIPTGGKTPALKTENNNNLR